MTYLPTSNQGAAGNTSNNFNDSALVTATVDATAANLGATVQPSVPSRSQLITESFPKDQ